MSGQIFSIRSIALAAPLLLWGVGIAVPANTVRAAECLGAPTSAPPEGSHWYYHTDRTKNRKCWFLDVLGTATQRAASQDASAPATRSGTVEKPATASVGVPASTSTGNSTPPLLPPASMSGAATHGPVRQPTQQDGAAPPIAGIPVPQASTSLQTSVQESDVTPAAPMAWPDPPTVATVQPQKPNLVPSNTPPDAVPSTVDARPSRDSVGAAQNGALTSQAAKTTTSSVGTFVEILLSVALGLTVASLLYRLVIKMTALRGQRIIMAHSGLDWVHDDPHEHAVRVAWQPRGFVNEREKFVDDLHLSLVPAAGGYAARHPRHADNESRNNRRREGSASRITDAHRERENRCVQLLRDLDQLLQSKKEA